MSLSDGQRVEQAVEVVGGRVLVAFAQVVGLVVAAPGITDHPIAGFGKDRLLVSPNLGITCRGRMQKDHRLALTARVGVENIPAQALSQSTFGRHLLGQGYGIHWIGGVIADKAFAHRILLSFIAGFIFFGRGAGGVTYRCGFVEARNCTDRDLGSRRSYWFFSSFGKPYAPT